MASFPLGALGMTRKEQTGLRTFLKADRFFSEDRKGPESEWEGFSLTVGHIRRQA